MESGNGKKPVSDPKPAAAKADTLGRQLKDSLARRRPRPWLPTLAVLAGSALLLTFLAYWYYPRPQPPPLQILALDVVCVPSEELRVRAQLLAPPDDASLRQWSGQTIVFHKILPPKATDKPPEIVASSDAHGQASAAWPMPKAMLGDFLVNYIDQERKLVQSDQGRIFVWPKEAPILIVDANETLNEEELKAQAPTILARAAKEGWHIVYLGLTSDKPHSLRLTRNWIAANPAKLPIGPVLGRAHYAGEESEAKSRRAVLGSLKDRFDGPLLAVVKNVESAQISQEAGVSTILLGAGPPPAGVVHAPTWADVVIPPRRAN